MHIDDPVTLAALRRTIGRFQAMSIRLHARLVGVGIRLLDAGTKYCYLILQAIQPIEDILAIGFLRGDAIQPLGFDHPVGPMQDASTQQLIISGHKDLAASARCGRGGTDARRDGNYFSPELFQGASCRTLAHAAESFA